MKKNNIPRNEYIRKPVGKTNPYKQDVIYDPMGQWKYPGQVTKIPSNQITMQGVNYPVYGEDDLGYGQMMYPGANYTFPGEYVTEIPMAQKGQQLPGKRKGNPISDWWYNTEDVQSTYKMAPEVDPFLVNWLKHPETQKRLKNNLASSVLIRDLNPADLTKQALSRLSTLPIFSRELVKNKDISSTDIEYNNQLQGWKSPSTILSNPYFSGSLGELGVYLPDYHVSMVNKFNNPGTIIHEQTHATGPFQEAMEDVIFSKYYNKKQDPDKRFIELFGKHYDENYNAVYDSLDKVKQKFPAIYNEYKERDKYLDKDGMYPRIMDIRRTLNLKPGQKVNKSILDNKSINLPVDDLRNYYDDDTIIDMLNTLAKVDTDINIKRAQNGKQVQDTDSWLENVFEAFDPTGISSWDDVYRAYKNEGTKAASKEAMGAIPGLGKISKLAKTAAVTRRQVKSANTLGNIDKLSKLTNAAQSINEAANAKSGFTWDIRHGEVPKYNGRNIFPQIQLGERGDFAYGGDPSLPDLTGHYQEGGDYKLYNPYNVMFYNLPIPLLRPTAAPEVKEKYSQEQSTGIDANLLNRQMYRESRFNPKAVSPAKAKGLAQIKDDAKEDAIKAGIISKDADIFNPAVNKKVQEWYMNNLYNASFINKPGQKDSVKLAKTLAAYNWGRGNVLRHLNEQKKKGIDIYNSYDWLKGLPKETSNYVNTILLKKDPEWEKNYKKAYKKYYKKEEGGWLDEYQKGGRSPIYLTDANDPRIRAYNDSLAAYNLSKKNEALFNKNPGDPLVAQYNKQGADLTKRTGIQPVSIKGSLGWTQPYRKEDLAQIEDAWIAKFKKPVQPYIYKKEEEKEKPKQDNIIYVDDKNDPRYIAYRDSSELYNWNPKLYAQAKKHLESDDNFRNTRFQFDKVKNFNELINKPFKASDKKRHLEFTKGYPEVSKKGNIRIRETGNPALPESIMVFPTHPTIAPISGATEHLSWIAHQYKKPVQEVRLREKPKEKAEYMQSRPVSMPTMSPEEMTITGRIKTPSTFVKQKFDPVTRRYYPYLVEGWNTPAEQGQRIYNRDIPSGGFATPEGFVPQFKPTEDKPYNYWETDNKKKVVKKKQEGGWLDNMD